MDNMIKKLIKFITNNKFYTQYELLNLSLVSISFKNELIQNNEFMYNYFKLKNEIQKLLSYDKTIYNKYYYERLLIKTNMQINFDKYISLKIPSIKYTIFSENKIYYTEDSKLIYDIYLLIKEYTKSPTTSFIIYPYDKLFEYLKNIKNDTKLYHFNKDNINKYNIIYLIPLFYKTNINDFNTKINISTICYVNIIDSNNNINLKDRFIVITRKFKLENFINKEKKYNFDNIIIENNQYLLDIHNSIKTDDNKLKLKEYCYLDDILNNSFNIKKILENFI